MLQRQQHHHLGMLIVPCNRLTLHKYRSDPLWRLITQKKKGQCHMFKKKNDRLTACCRKFYDGVTNMLHKFGPRALWPPINENKNVIAHPPQQEMNCPRHSPAVDSIIPTTYLRARNTVIILVRENENLHPNLVTLKPSFSCLSIPTLKTSVEIYKYYKHRSK